MGPERTAEREAGMQQDAGRTSLGVGGAFAPFAESLEATLPEPLALSDVARMTPMEIAQSSELVTSSYRELVGMALSLQNEAYRRLMLSVLKDTRVTFMELYPERSDREEIRGELARFGYMSEEDDVDELFPPRPEDPQPYLASPQSHEDLYNPHPGGMAITCAVNCRLSEYHTMLYREHFGVPADRDLAVAGLCIHEYPKAWLYYWNEDGSYGIEPRTFGGNMHTHDVYVTAEMLHRGAPPELVVGVAAAHSFGAPDLTEDGKETRMSWPGYEWVKKFLHAGALLAQRDPVEAGVLEPGEKVGEYVLPPQPVEIWNCHLSDMNWPYTAGAAHKYTFPLLGEVAREEYGIASPEGREFNQLKNYVYAQVGQIALYEALVREGEGAARRIVKRLVNSR
jgi:hypothetical protein